MVFKMVVLSKELEDEIGVESGKGISLVKWCLFYIFVKEEIVSKVKGDLKRDCIWGGLSRKGGSLMIGEGGVGRGVTF